MAKVLLKNLFTIARKVISFSKCDVRDKTSQNCTLFYFFSTIYRWVSEHHSLTTLQQIWNNLFECQIVNFTVQTTFVEIAIFYIQLFQICLFFHAIQIFIFRCFLNSINFDVKMANSDKCGNFFWYQKTFKIEYICLHFHCRIYLATLTSFHSIKTQKKIE